MDVSDLTTPHSDKTMPAGKIWKDRTVLKMLNGVMPH